MGGWGSDRKSPTAKARAQLNELELYRYRSVQVLCAPLLSMPKLAFFGRGQKENMSRRTQEVR